MARLDPSRPGAPRPRSSWRSWEGLAVVVFVAAMLGALASGSELFLGIMVMLLGLGCFGWALTRTPEQMHRQLDHTGQPVGWLIGKIPGAGAKVAFLAMCAGIALLGTTVVIAAI